MTKRGAARAYAAVVAGRARSLLVVVTALASVLIIAVGGTVIARGGAAPHQQVGAPSDLAAAGVDGPITAVAGAPAADRSPSQRSPSHRSAGSTSAGAARSGGTARHHRPAAHRGPGGTSAGQGATKTHPGRSKGRHGATRPAAPIHLEQATLIARQAAPLSAVQLAALRAVPGVDATVVVGSGQATVDGHHAQLLSVAPRRFRPWTPRLTARSDPLWASIGSGELTASFDMGHGAKLPLGHTVPVRARHRVPTRIGAFASVGMAGVDGVVDGALGRRLGLPSGNAVVISAPTADPLVLRTAVSAALGDAATTTLLREVVTVRQAGEFMTDAQISTILHVAASRIGRPYVWGAEGPTAFDCSGLVQWSFAHAGITMPRVSEEQFFAGPHVPYSDARPGDLLFWHYDPTDPKDVDHVAIYAGDGKMIVAPHTGLDVMVEAVPLAHLAGVVRVDPALSGAVGG